MRRPCERLHEASPVLASSLGYSRLVGQRQAILGCYKMQFHIVCVNLLKRLRYLCFCASVLHCCFMHFDGRRKKGGFFDLDFYNGLRVSLATV